MLDVASLAMRLWNEHRESASLPRWEVVGLEIVEKEPPRVSRRARATRLTLPFGAQAAGAGGACGGWTVTVSSDGIRIQGPGRSGTGCLE